MHRTVILSLCLAYSLKGMSVTVADVAASKWNTTFLSNGQGFQINAKLEFNQQNGSYIIDSNLLGKLQGITYQASSDTVKVAGAWALNGQAGKFQFTIAENGETFDGTWNNQTTGDSGTWKGNRLSKTPDPSATNLPIPATGPRNMSQFLNRHARAVVHALKAFDPGCETQLFTSGPDVFIGGEYQFQVNQKHSGTAKVIDTRLDSNLVPFEAAIAVIPRLKAGGSPCLFLTPEQVQKASSGATASAVESTASANLEKLKTESANGTWKGRMNGPSIVVSNDEVVINDPMDAEKQKELLTQSDQGVQEKKTVNGPTTPVVTEKAFGARDFLELKAKSEVKRPTFEDLNFSGKMDVEVLFLKQPNKILSASARSLPNVELREVRLTAEVKALTAQGFKVVKSVDETKSTTFERPEEIFYKDVVIAKYPPQCTPTPVGPACIEGSIVGSAGIKPYGITFNPDKFSDWQAYVRPYAHIDLDVFGGLEFGVAHAGIRGQVAILDGTIAVLAGNVSEDTKDPCVRVELDKLTFLNGRIYIDMQGETLPAADVENVAATAERYCDNVKGAGGLVINWKENVTSGFISAGAEVGNTASDIADSVQEIAGEAAATGKDAAKKLTETVSSSLPKANKKFPLVPFAASGPNFSNSTKNLLQTDCRDVHDRVVQAAALRYVKELYHWEGVELDRHHKWHESCTSPQ